MKANKRVIVSKIARGAVVTATVICIIVAGFVCGTAMQASIDGRSATSKLVEIVMFLFVHPNKPSSPDKSYSDIDKAAEKNKNYTVPTLYKTMLDFSTEQVEGFEVCYFGDAEAEYTALYFHGGIFMYQPTYFHFDYCKRLADELNARVVMPVYPKAPEYNYRYTLDYMTDIYLGILQEKEADKVIFVGDSAGASMLISLSQKLSDENIQQPKQLIAYSPCIDIRLSNPEIEALEHLDPMLNKENIRIKINAYTEGTDSTDPYVNPIFVDYTDIAPLAVFMGTHEILLPDMRALYARIEEQNITTVDYFEYQYMNHVFAIYPMPESIEVLSEVKMLVFGE